jgi:hypothetical protein
MIKSFAFYISLVSILPFLLFGCNSATQQTEKAVPQTEATEATTPSSTEVSNTVESPSPVESVPAVVASAKKIAPGELFKLGFDNKVRVEIVRVNRIQSRETGKQDLVNVQFRIRRTGDGFANDDAIYAGDMAGRNQEDSSVYSADRKNCTQYQILLKDLKKGASVDAYAWLPVTEGVESMEIKIPGVEAFANVPIEAYQEQTVSKTNDKVEPGKFIQPSFENRAKVELLQVNRVKNGENQGKVHIRFRVSRAGDKVFDNDELSYEKITASNINTNEVYRQFTRGFIQLNKLKKGELAEASILIQVPDDVYSFNINMPSTQAFKNVPIE